MRAYWWRGRANFGDELNSWLLERLGAPFEWAAADSAELVICGSTLEHLPSKWTGTVCGAGMLRETSHVDLSHANVLAVRGHLTAQRAQYVPTSVVLGDPGLLVSRWVPQTVTKYDLGVVPHWSDTELYRRFPYGKLIDVRQPPGDVIRDIARCKRIVSSSLHGIIVADSFSIPRRAELFPNATSVKWEGGDFKFRDYSSVFGTHPHFGEFWRAPYDEVERIRNRLRGVLAEATNTPPPLAEVDAPPDIPPKKGRRPQISILVPYRRDKTDTEHRNRLWDWLAQYWHANLPQAEIIVGHDGSWPYCADTQTEILTSSGWKSYDAVQINEQVLTLNHTTGLSEWQPIDAVNIFDVVDEPMLYSDGRGHSSFTTLNHRWPIVRPSGKGLRKPRVGFRGGRTWATSAALTTGDKVPIAAQCADLPVEPKYTDAFVEVVAWAWTEGTFCDHNILITQSKTKNLANCERIRAALTVLVGPSVDRLDHSGTQWREYEPSDPDDNRAMFCLGTKVSDTIRCAAPDRVPSFEFLLSLTRSQLALFIEASILGDGWNITAGGQMLAQKNPKAAEAFQFACILAGHATSTYKAMKGNTTKYGYDMTGVYLRVGRLISPIDKQVCEHRNYTGKVWCPTTKNGTWLARRRGTVYFTGNSKCRSVNWAAERARGKVLAIIDADAYLDARVVQQCADNIIAALKDDRKLWYVPYRRLHRLSEQFTVGLLDDDPTLPYSIPSPPNPEWLEPGTNTAVNYGYLYGAMAMIMPTEAFFTVGGMDGRFMGWGGEDVSFLKSLDTLYGLHEVTYNDILHLWHLRPGRDWKTRLWIGQGAGLTNSRLSQRYSVASGEPEWMRGVIHERIQATPLSRSYLRKQRRQPWW